MNLHMEKLIAKCSVEFVDFIMSVPYGVYSNLKYISKNGNVHDINQYVVFSIINFMPKKF